MLIQCHHGDDTKQWEVVVFLLYVVRWVAPTPLVLAPQFLKLKIELRNGVKIPQAVNKFLDPTFLYYF
jgi:hypothetical protein